MTGAVVARWEDDAPEVVGAAVARAHDRFTEWRRLPFADRAKVVGGLADVLATRRDDLALLMATEMGKPITQGRAEVDKCATTCRWYAEQAEALLADRTIATEHTRSLVHHEPLGVVLAIMPWNFPFWQAIRFLAPALMAGNAGVLKHAANVTGCALALGEAVEEAGAPEGLFGVLKLPSSRVAEVIAHPLVRAVTLTGSAAVGRAVAAEAGRHLKKTVLELGGSDPFVVMPSADLDEAVKTAIRARTLNSGQSCIAAKRFIIHEAVYEEFEQNFAAGMESLRVGDPTDDATEIGPLATEQVLKYLDAQVSSLVAAGARVILGGGRLARPGFYYAPTVLAEIPEDAPARREELFGPVAMLFRVASIDEAIRLANDTPYGLGASAWTNDEREAGRLVEEIEAGSVFVNGLVASDPRLPFGGTKRSGHGRELGAHGLLEFVNVKTVWVQSWRHPS